MTDYSDFYGLEGDTFNIEAVCPDYLSESQCTFTWYRYWDGIAIISGYDPEDDPSAHWLCDCGNFVTDGSCHCSCCKAEAPWGCDCGFLDEDEYDEDLDLGMSLIHTRSPYDSTRLYNPSRISPSRTLSPNKALLEMEDYICWQEG